jgi:uncharacterized membrane protein YhaH (DUF805 family)
MTFSDSIKTCLSKYTTWQGRATRSEYWYFYLFMLICMVVAAVIDSNGYLAVLVVLGLTLPQLAVTVRRLHDTGRSGWWYWIGLIPLVGGILLLVWFCSRGTVGSNQYGSDPLGGDLSQTFG